MIEVHAPAKLNFFLEVLGRRTDGYHEIETLMLPIALYDTLQLSDASPGGIRLTCSWATGCAGQRTAVADRAGSVGSAGTAVRDAVEGVWQTLPQGTDNLVVKALELLRSRAGVDCGAVVRLEKRIPAAAGLGGASSDAAAALLAANLAWRLDWSRPQLAEVAADVGSDVPFFLAGGPAVCRGRGERVEPLAGGAGWQVVVVRPPAGLATAEVYRHCRVPDRPRAIAAAVAAVRSGDAAGAGRALANRLQEAAEQLSPWIARLRDAFGRLGCWGHQLTGSGTSYFGLCRHARHARHVAARLRAARLGTVFVASTLG